MFRRRTKKLAQRVGGLGWSFLRKKVSAAQRTTANVIAPRSPQSRRSRLILVPLAEWTVPTPQHKHGAHDPATARLIDAVVFAIDGRGRAVVLADRVSVPRVLKGLHVRGSHVRRERPSWRPPVFEGVVHDSVGRRRENALRKRFGL